MLLRRRVGRRADAYCCHACLQDYRADADKPAADNGLPRTVWFVFLLSAIARDPISRGRERVHSYIFKRGDTARTYFRGMRAFATANGIPASGHTGARSKSGTCSVMLLFIIIIIIDTAATPGIRVIIIHYK